MYVQYICAAIWNIYFTMAINAISTNKTQVNTVSIKKVCYKEVMENRKRTELRLNYKVVNYL